MKKTAILAAVASMVLLIAGCGKTEAEMKYLTDFDASKYVELCNYKGIEVTAPKAEVSDEEMQTYIDYILSYYKDSVEITDRDEAKDGDIANIDYVGTLDGVAFEGGTAEGYDLALGSHSFIDGFEAGVVGMKVGETRELELTFPENYGKEDLAGKAVIFTVTLNALKEEKIPELNDEFVKSMGNTFQTVEEFKAQLRSDMMSDAEENRDAEIDQQIQTYVMDNSTFKDAPSGMIDRMYNSLVTSLADSAASMGVDVGMIASYYYGVSADNYEQEMRDYVKDTLTRQYVFLGAIANKEKIKITEDDINSEIEKSIKQSGANYTVEEYKAQIGDMDAYKEYVLLAKVMKFLRENAVINEE